MKKFLTVLLALSVVFTYSFSSVGAVFAAADDQTAWDLLVEDAAVQAKGMANTAYNEAVKTLPDADPGLAASVAVDADFWKASASVYGNKLEKLIAEKTKEIKALYGTNQNDVKNKTLAQVLELFATAKGADYVTGATSNQELVPATPEMAEKAIQDDPDVKLAVAKAYGKDVAANAIVSLENGIDTTIYSDAVNKETNMSSREMADALIAKAVADIQKVDFNVDAITDVDAALAEVGAFGTADYDAVKDIISNEKAGKGYLAIFVEAKNTQFNVTKYAIKSDTTYDGESLVTKDDEAEKAEDFLALRESYLAKVSSVYSAYITANKGANYRAEADAYKAGVSEIINAAANYNELVAIFVNVNAVPTLDSDLAKSHFEENKVLVDDVVIIANKYIAEGLDAEEINKIVAGAKVQAYKANAAWNGTWNGTEDAVDAIEAAVVKQFDTKIIDKEVAELELALEKLLDEDATPGYYAPEAEQVKALYETIIGEVKACISEKALDKVNMKYFNKKNPATADYKAPAGLNKIDDKTDVQNAIKKTTDEWANNMTKVEAYAISLNAGTKPEEVRDFVSIGIFDAIDSLDEEWLVNFYAEKGARTTAEATNLIAAAKAKLESVMTAAQVDAAIAAVEAQIAALPEATKITADDAAAVEAAWEANQKLIEETGGKISASAQKTLDNAVKAAGLAERLALIKAINAYDVNKVTAADKAELEALLADANAFNEKVADGVYKGTTVAAIPSSKAIVQNCLAKIRTNAKNAVLDAIKKLPITVTKDNVGLVDAAEKLYNEYVDTYTDFYTAIADVYGVASGFNQDARADITVKADLEKAIKAADKIRAEIAAEEKEAAIAAVKAFEISTTTQLVKGKKMIVKWTVKGDESAIDGYRVYYSTKKSNAGFKVLADVKGKKLNHTSIKKTVKKGTRVYYRVKAYKMIDGLRYLSAYSSAGHRTWK